MSKPDRNLQPHMKLFTTNEAAKLLQVDTQYLRAFVRQYRLPHFHASQGRLMLWDKDQIDRVKAARKKIEAMTAKIEAMKNEIKNMTTATINEEQNA